MSHIQYVYCAPTVAIEILLTLKKRESKSEVMCEGEGTCAAIMREEIICITGTSCSKLLVA